MAERPTIDVPDPTGGWGAPWPNVAEIATVLPSSSWTLVGGLMTQLHAIHRGVDAVRPTNDVDIVLHVETTRGVVAASAAALEALGYGLVPSLDHRRGTAYRFRRGDAVVDLVSSGPDVVDVLVADHCPLDWSRSCVAEAWSPLRAARRRCDARSLHALPYLPDGRPR